MSFLAGFFIGIVLGFIIIKRGIRKEIDEIIASGIIRDREYKNYLVVPMPNLETSLISNLDPKEIIKYQDIDHLLEAIGAERVGEWFMGLGSR